jgi:hypothetical protein
LGKRRIQYEEELSHTDEITMHGLIMLNLRKERIMMSRKRVLHLMSLMQLFNGRVREVYEQAVA